MKTSGNPRKSLALARSHPLETVFGPAPKVFQDAAPGEPGRLNLKGDLDLLVFTFCEVRRSYAQLPARLLCDLVLQMRESVGPQAGGPEVQRASLENEVACRSRCNVTSRMPRTRQVSMPDP